MTRYSAPPTIDAKATLIREAAKQARVRLDGATAPIRRGSDNQCLKKESESMRESIAVAHVRRVSVWTASGCKCNAVCPFVKPRDKESTA